MKKLVYLFAIVLMGGFVASCSEDGEISDYLVGTWDCVYQEDADGRVECKSGEYFFTFTKTSVTNYFDNEIGGTFAYSFDGEIVNVADVQYRLIDKQKTYFIWEQVGSDYKEKFVRRK